MDQPGLRLLIATEKSMESLVVTKDLVFCSGMYGEVGSDEIFSLS